MSDLNKTTGGVVTTYPITPTQVSNVYDVLTGDLAYGNIGVSKFTHLNSGGTFGDSGYGLKNNSGTMVVKNSGGSWTNINSGLITPAGSQREVQINSGGGYTAASSFHYNNYNRILRVGDTTNDDTYISMSDSYGNITLCASGVTSMGDYHGVADGTYISVDDATSVGSNYGVERVQSEGVVTIGDFDWAGYGTDTHIEVNDDNSQISMSAVGGVMVGQLATGVTVDAAADSKGKLQVGVSDYRLKENIEPIKNALDKVLNLNGVTFQYKKENDRKRYIGLIAQEVEKVLPEVVFKNDDYYGINYKLVVSTLIEAVKERQKQIENLKERLNKFD